MGWIGTSELFLAILAMPYAITMLFIMKRFGGHGPIRGSHVDEAEGYNMDDKTHAVEAEMVTVGKLELLSSALI
tara:strand:- start:27 stop:248 length:222 start_codon:yes stop_codon:yes gene_type:complete